MTYIETFDDGPGGWLGWISNAQGPRRLEIRDSCAIERSPWWIDYNHAPPGAGYLHLPFSLSTRPHFKQPEHYARLSGPNRFIDGGYPTDFTNARITLRLRGPINLRGAKLLCHIQTKLGGVFVNYCLTGLPFEISDEWSEQTVQLIPDPHLWTPLGARHDRTDFYGHGDLRPALRDVNNNIILALFPLNIFPLSPTIAAPHRLKAGEDYPVDTSKLPEGTIMLDEVRIDFADDAPRA